MSEAREQYLFTADPQRATINAAPQDSIVVSRAELVNIKRQCISLLVTVELALGDEPSVVTRSMRRKR